MSAVHPKEIPKFESFAKSVLKQGWWADELTCQTKSGAFLSAEISGSVMKVNGQDCILALVRDITERKQAEDILAQLGSFPIQNPNPVIETDLTGAVTYCNPAADELFPDLREKRHQHPILSGVKLLIIACQTGTHEAMTRELQLGDAVYEQKICCVPQSNHIRIFVYDLTSRVRAEALEQENTYLREEMEMELAFGEIVGQQAAPRHMVLRTKKGDAPSGGCGRNIAQNTVRRHFVVYFFIRLRPNATRL